MTAAEIKKIEMENGRTFKVVKVVGDQYTVLNDGIVSHMSMDYVVNEIASGRAIAR